MKVIWKIVDEIGNLLPAMLLIALMMGASTPAVFN